jgi:predicted SnoaL-like aldol condensation-catalyzing enzyme
MENTNVKVVEEYIEVVFNQKHLERLAEFCSEECIVHAPPYVGLGVNFDGSFAEKFVLVSVSPNGPAFGHLQIGDELVRVRNGAQTWETMEEFRNGQWSMGWVGAEIILTVRRHGNLVTIPLRLGYIDQLDAKLSEIQQVVIPYLQQYWPDLKINIRQIFGAEEWVAVYAVNHGTNREYNRSATWGEMDMFRLKDGKITEVWYVEGTLDELKQLGYQIHEPIRELA